MRRGFRRLLRRAAIAVGEIRLEAEDGTELLGGCRSIKRPGGVQVSVIGDRQAVHPEFLHLRHQVRNSVGAVEQGILAVGMEMGERHVFRAGS